MCLIYIGYSIAFFYYHQQRDIEQVLMADRLPGYIK